MLSGRVPGNGTLTDSVGLSGSVAIVKLASVKVSAPKRRSMWSWAERVTSSGHQTYSSGCSCGCIVGIEEKRN